jgi:hypothetical protein
MENIIKESLTNFKYLSGYQRGVVISEQAETQTLGSTSMENIRKFGDEAKKAAKEIQRNKKSDEKKCKEIMKAMQYNAGGTELCGVIKQCKTDGFISSSAVFEPCKKVEDEKLALDAKTAADTKTAEELKKTEELKKVEDAKTSEIGKTQIDPQSNQYKQMTRFVNSKCFSGFKWFTMDTKNSLQIENGTYYVVGQDSSGNEIRFYYEPESDSLGNVKNMTTGRSQRWVCSNQQQPSQIVQSGQTAQSEQPSGEKVFLYPNDKKYEYTKIGGSWKFRVPGGQWKQINAAGATNLNNAEKNNTLKAK